MAEMANNKIIQKKTPMSKGQSVAAIGLNIPRMVKGETIAGRGFMISSKITDDFRLHPHETHRLDHLMAQSFGKKSP